MLRMRRGQKHVRRGKQKTRQQKLHRPKEDSGGGKEGSRWGEKRKSSLSKQKRPIITPISFYLASYD